jgi:serine/threonine protein kinase/tetratricopeptide (TPR) repeat protein
VAEGSTDEQERSDQGGEDDVLARGATVGRYLVLERLGAGAMGVVYAAYDPKLERKIAVKLLRPVERRGDQARRTARLEREAQAMAKLSHPNVGSIFDVGVHEGQVFLAMEYLAGGTLHQWIDGGKRPWRETVRMFIAVGHGLAAAHAEGLIHRDFKPDNVLLDKAGTPKVVDFGLVRLTDALEGSGDDPVVVPADDPDLPIADTAIPESSRSGAGPLTRTGALTGTPAYMAAEQFLGKVIDARTDQFAFCVALHEALYGERPFPGDTLFAVADSVTSDRIIAAPKGTNVPGWVRGHVLRGLRADPSQRHRSMDDLLGALADDPAKRTRKWVLGGSTAVAIVAIAAVTHKVSADRRPPMCTGGGDHLVGIWETGGVPSPRKEAIHRAFAVTGKSYAEQAYTGVARLLDQYAERWTGMYTEACQATQVRGEQSPEVLDLRMACLNERLGNARALSDVFADADAKVVENAVTAAAALPPLDSCSDVPLLRAVVKPPEDPAARKKVDELRSELAHVTALLDSGQCSRALPQADGLIAKIRGVNYQPLLADALFAAGQVGNECGDFAQMLARLKEAHLLASASHSDEVAAKAAALIPSFAINRLAEVQVAREWLLVAEGDVSRLGRTTVASAMLAQAEGTLAVNDHDYGHALEAADRSIAITSRLLGPDDPLTIAWKLNKGLWQQAAGKLDDALQTDIEGRKQWERVLGPDHVRVALIWSNQGEVLNLLGRYHDADGAYRRAAEIMRQSGAAPAFLAWVLTGLGTALIGENEPAAAVGPLEEALAIRIEDHASPRQLGETRFALARALWPRTETHHRALALAQTARNDYEGDKDGAAKLDAWLAGAHAHPSRSAPRAAVSYPGGRAW